MKKTRRCAAFILTAITVLALAQAPELSVPDSLEQIHNTVACAQAADDTDGVYTIEGRLWHATMDQPSMGNSAVAQPMKIIRSGGEAVLQMEFQPLSSGVFSGYLYSLQYFPSWNHEEKLPEGAEAVPVTVTEYYNGIYDGYNHPSDGLDEEIRGKLYPHYAVLPIQWNTASVWTQVYVPVMEAISEGSGRQYARLQLDWSTLKKTGERAEDISVSPADASPGNADIPDSSATVPKESAPSGTGNGNKKASGSSDEGSSGSSKKKKLKIHSLEDGIYTITGEMRKPDRKSKSMSNEAVGHHVILTVRDGKYSLTVSLSGLTVGNSKGYLSRLKYFKAGYKKDKNGVPTGTKTAVTIKAYQKDSSGKRISDSYGTDYPAKVTFPMIAEAKKDGYVPLQVFVPVMEDISAGTGTQPVYLKLDFSSIAAGEKSTKSNSGKKASAAKNNANASESSGTSSGRRSKGNSAAPVAKAASDGENAVEGTVYSCQVVSSYKHPVTGIVEDSGGTSSYATGQGMAESVMGTSGMLEETESGAYYLTVRMGLMDLTSGHTFWVQKRGESSWDAVSATVTQNGSDKNGRTSDFCFMVPDKDSIVKVSMYVEPMGRNVVFYASVKNLKKGQPKDMKAIKVSVGEAVEGGKETVKDEENGEDTSVSLSDSAFSNAQGLSLSTEGEKASAADDAVRTEKKDGGTAGASGSGGMSFGKWILALTVSATLSGLLLMSAGAWLVYYFRRNWRRWGEEMADDED